jgi:3',5'-cyclic-AMP phosphodiesterase
LLTDVHFGPRAYYGGKLRKLTDMADELTTAFVKRMNESERPDLVVNLGDVIEDENRERDLEQYGRFLEILSGLASPVAHVAGNHDRINLSDADLLSLWGRSGRLHYSFDLGGFHFLVIETIEIKDRAVHLPEDETDFVERDLASTTLPTLVLMHHPASDQLLEGNRWFERAPHLCRIAERKQLRRAFEASGKVRAVFNGHVHWNHFDVIGGIPYFTLQSLIENVEDDAPGRPAAAFTLCDIGEHRMVVNVFGADTARYQIEG